MPVRVQLTRLPASRDPCLLLLLWGGVDLIQAVARDYLLWSPPAYRLKLGLRYLRLGNSVTWLALTASTGRLYASSYQRPLSYLLCDIRRVVPYKVHRSWQRRCHACHLPYSHEPSGK
jgi:hypothetical protein